MQRHDAADAAPSTDQQQAIALRQVNVLLLRPTFLSLARLAQHATAAAAAAAGDLLL